MPSRRGPGTPGWRVGMLQGATHMPTRDHEYMVPA